MVKKSGNEVTHYFSTASGLLIGSETTQESPMGTVNAVVKLSDYKEVDGIKFAGRTEMVVGPNTIVTTVKQTTFNSVPDSAFAIPDVIKPLINK